MKKDITFFGNLNYMTNINDKLITTKTLDPELLCFRKSIINSTALSINKICFDGINFYENKNGILYTMNKEFTTELFRDNGFTNGYKTLCNVLDNMDKLYENELYDINNNKLKNLEIPSIMKSIEYKLVIPKNKVLIMEPKTQTNITRLIYLDKLTYKNLLDFLSTFKSELSTPVKELSSVIYYLNQSHEVLYRFDLIKSVVSVFNLDIFSKLEFDLSSIYFNSTNLLSFFEDQNYKQPDYKKYFSDKITKNQVIKLLTNSGLIKHRKKSGYVLVTKEIINENILSSILNSINDSKIKLDDNILNTEGLLDLINIIKEYLLGKDSSFDSTKIVLDNLDKITDTIKDMIK